MSASASFPVAGRVGKQHTPGHQHVDRWPAYVAHLLYQGEGWQERPATGPNT